MAIGYNPSIVSDGLVFYLDAANTRSYSGSGVTTNGLVAGIGATLINGVGFTSANNGVFVLDGTNDYVSVPNGFTSYFKSNDYWSVDLWVKLLNQTAGEPVLVSAGPNIGYFDLFLEVGDNQIYFAAGRGSDSGYIQNQNVSNTLGYNLAARYFNIVFTKTGSTTGSVSVNSINMPMSNSGGGLSSMPNINEDLRIGTFRQSGFELHGNIGQVKIYNRALTQQEILQNFNATRFRYGI
jgi:hypothetical protein